MCVKNKFVISLVLIFILSNSSLIKINAEEKNFIQEEIKDIKKYTSAMPWLCAWLRCFAKIYKNDINKINERLSLIENNLALKTNQEKDLEKDLEKDNYQDKISLSANKKYNLSEIKIPNGIKKNKFLSYYKAKKFFPNKKLNFADAVMMIYNLIYNNPEAEFPEALNYLEEKNIILDNNNRFYPGKEITRGEIAQFLFNVLLNFADKNQKLIYGDEQINFKDAVLSRAIKHLASNKMLDGYDDNYFRPNEYITRAESVAMIFKIFKLEKNNFENQKQKFLDIDDNYWAFDLIMSVK